MLSKVLDLFSSNRGFYLKKINVVLEICLLNDFSVAKIVFFSWTKIPSESGKYTVFAAKNILCHFDEV